MPSPPKPWERIQDSPDPISSTSLTSSSSSSSPSSSIPTNQPNTSSTFSSLENNSLSQTSNNDSNGSSTAIAPAVPPRQPDIYSTNSSYMRPGYSTGYGSGYNPYGTSAYATSSYGSPYSGAYGSSYGSAYGGYSSISPYNRYGTSPYGAATGRLGYGYGYGGRYGGMYGPEGENGISSRLESGTQATFALLEQIVAAFGGFAQMLESTFFATHSSFMAVMGVAEQFGHLRGYLGQVFSIVLWFQGIKSFLRRFLRGGSTPTTNKELLNVDEFQQMNNSNGFKTSSNLHAISQQPRTSRRGMLAFLAIVFGLPYLMSRFIRHQSANEQARNSEGLPHNTANFGIAVDPSHTLHPSDIKNLEFCKALYDFNGQNAQELSFKRGDIIAILRKDNNDWWRGRLKRGNIGLFPSNYVEIIEKKSNRDVDKPKPSSGNDTTGGIDANEFLKK